LIIPDKLTSMVITHSDDLKFYLYISTSKIRMLYEQLSTISTTKGSFEWNLDLKLGGVKGGTTTERTPNRDAMLREVVQALESTDQIGNLREPKSFIRDVFPVRWGFYNDCSSRPEEEPALIYFGGLSDGILLGMGGSSCHVVGHEGATSTWSRSATPTLTRWLLSGLREGECPKIYGPYNRQQEEHQVFQAMAIAQHYLRPPTQQVEFVAKTIAVGDVDRVESYIGVEPVKAILATPLYVAQVTPLRDNPFWGVLEGDWLLESVEEPEPALPPSETDSSPQPEQHKVSRRRS
jgi:hypothetical protein